MGKLNQPMCMHNIKIADPSTSEEALQPLREVGSCEKSQYWDREDIMGALRFANLRGIRVESLYAPRMDDEEVETLPQRAS